jgi:hypothetical protein
MDNAQNYSRIYGRIATIVTGVQSWTNAVSDYLLSFNVPVLRSSIP